MKSYKLDLHVHTAEVSRCGMVEAEKAVKLYNEKGYDGLVITDHFNQIYFDKLPELSWEKKIDNYLKGYREAVRAGDKYGLDVFLGMELRFIGNRNEYLIYGIDEKFLYHHPNLFKMNLPQLSQLLKEKDILIYQAHPFREGMTIVNPQLLDGMEVFNGNPRHDSRNNIAYMFADEYNLKMISASDFHQTQDIGSGIILPQKVKTRDELVSMLKNNKVEELLNSTSC